MSILCISTSSPWASVALLDDNGTVLWSEIELAQNRASGTCFEIFDRQGLDLTTVTLFAADIGPGSFTGVRVGVTIAKTLAYLQKRQVVGADAFDLVASDRDVVLPSKKGEYFLRRVGQSPIRTTEIDVEHALGYPLGDRSTPPNAANFSELIESLEPQDPMRFLPKYLIDPSISTPKKPYRGAI